MIKYFSVNSALLFLLLNGADAAEALSGEARVTSTVIELVGEKTSEYFKNVVDINAPIEWNMYVADNYDPEVPAGLMVYVSPSDSGEIPRKWKDVMAAQNMIWVSANNSGNSVDGGLRVTYAVLAPTLARRDFNIDNSRVYVSGFSGGGRVASIIAPEYAHIFKGAIYNCGVNFWGRKTPSRMEQIKSNRYVFVTGSDDFNRRETRKAFKSYKKAGANNVKLMDIAHMGHDNPSSANYSEAIEFLDLVE